MYFLESDACHECTCKDCGIRLGGEYASWNGCDCCCTEDMVHLLDCRAVAEQTFRDGCKLSVINDTLDFGEVRESVGSVYKAGACSIECI